ncbi:spermine oxidase-like isoform X2 [Mytilus trossulus]|uniref:spermine oxidase-like isoform X2 n=1 Tax=Mytilus trossulus TaxID=6551 RepID=UPI0030045516
MSSTDARVVVVGAGAAGLSAAHHLVQNGFSNVIVLEATDRIGGRIHTVEFGDGIIELGANWIHGTGKDNSMYTLAKEKGLIMEPYVFLDRKDDPWLTQFGNRIDSNIVQLATEIFEGIERELDEEIDYSKQLSCEDYFKIRFQEKLNQRKENESEQIQTVLDSLMKGFSLFTGDEARFISANLLHMSEEIDGVDITVPQGLSGVLQSLVDELPVNTVRYKRYVNRIQWNSGIDNKEVTIYCDFDSSVDEYVADHVIITCPLGHLKQNHEQLFEPPLPNVKIEAIERFEPGKVEAIFLHYEKPFWSKGKGSFFISQERIDGKSSGICSGYESAYWIREIPTCSNVLLIWIYGSDTDQIKSLTDTTIAERCTNLLRQYLGDKDIPEPTSVKITSWCSDPLVHGAYSYLSTNSHATCVTDIAEPLFVGENPVLCFAGEATHEKWFSYAHGARSSGIREADRIQSFYSQ